MIKDDDYCFMPLQQAISGPPNGFCQVISQRYWSVHPEKGLRFYNPMKKNGKRERLWGSPQCNSIQTITSRLAVNGDDVVYIERVWVPINLNEWIN